MLLSNSKRLKIQGIIKRIAQDESITLEERIYVEKFAHHNSTISLWLKKANSFRRNGTKNDGGIDNLLQSFGIDGLDKDCLLYTSPSPRDTERSRMPSSA